jgi:hypothetical protein
MLSVSHSRAGQQLTGTGREGIHAAVEDICRHGADIDFRRGFGTIWVSSPTGYYTKADRTG